MSPTVPSPCKEATHEMKMGAIPSWIAWVCINSVTCKVLSRLNQRSICDVQQHALTLSAFFQYT